MNDILEYPPKALKFGVKVAKNGHIDLKVPFPGGSRLTVFVVKEPEDNINDLLSAAESSLGFWDNPYDDEDWNDV